MRNALVLLALVVGTLPAHADDKAAASVAFAEGKRLMASGLYAKACAMFELSYNQDRQLGTLLNLGDCHEKVGKLATAWAEFGEAIELAQSRSDDRETYARQRRTKLATRLSYVTLRKSRTDMLTVKLNGRNVTALANVAIPVDPGKQLIEVEHDGESSRRTITIEHDATRRVIDVPFVPDEDDDGEADDDVDEREDPVDDATIDRTPPPPVPDDPLPPTSPPGSTRRTAGLAIGVVGIATIAVGSYFGIRAYLKWSDSRPLCNESNRCTSDGRALVDQSQSAAGVANILFGCGLAAVTLGAVLYVTAPKASTTTAFATPVVSPTSVGAAVTLRF